MLIRELAELDAERLSRVLVTTFEQRARKPLPSTVPPPPPSWANRTLGWLARVGVATDMDDGYAAAAELLDPVLGSDAEGSWDPRARRWRR